MANSRIKDISATASAPASDDYLVIDGATNGTRKISASSISGTMYDYTLFSGSTTTVSGSGTVARYCTVSNSDAITTNDLRAVKVYGVASNGYVYLFDVVRIYVTSGHVTIQAYFNFTTSTTMYVHVEAPFEITADTAAM